MQISALDYSSYVGAIGICRIKPGPAKPNMPVEIIDVKGTFCIWPFIAFDGLSRFRARSHGRSQCS